jgi:ankyrin repeat protein
MSGGPPLFVACETNNHDLLLEALKTNAVDTRSSNQSFTPLMVASNRAAIVLVKHLLEQGADVNAQSEGGHTPLILAIVSYNEMNAIKKVEKDFSNPSLSVIKTLLDAGANVNIATNGGNTALQEAALQGSPEITKLLLEKQADVNAVNQWKESALIVGALKSGNPEVAQMLLDAGADPNMTDVDGLTAIAMAEKSENTAVLNVLKGTDRMEIVDVKQSE